MGLGAKLADAATSGLTGAVTGGIGSIISGGLGLLGGLFKRNNNGFKNQQKLMQQAWEYEKEGMGLQTITDNKQQMLNIDGIYKCGKTRTLEHKKLKWKTQD
jgi:hypothetical protein